MKVSNSFKRAVKYGAKTDHLSEARAALSRAIHWIEGRLESNEPLHIERVERHLALAMDSWNSHIAANPELRQESPRTKSAIAMDGASPRQVQEALVANATLQRLYQRRLHQLAMDQQQLQRAQGISLASVFGADAGDRRGSNR